MEMGLSDDYYPVRIRQLQHKIHHLLKVAKGQIYALREPDVAWSALSVRGENERKIDMVCRYGHISQIIQINDIALDSYE
jgi:hypothetical protein